MKKQKNTQKQEKVIKTEYPISASMRKIGKKSSVTKNLKSEIVYKWKK